MGILTKSPKPDGWDSMDARQRRRYCEAQYRLREGCAYIQKVKKSAKTDVRRKAKKEKSAEYRDENRDALRMKYREYYKNNREKILIKSSEDRKKRKKTDTEYRIKCNLRSRFSGHLRRVGTTKTESVIDLIGCTASELMLKIEEKWQKGMSWENYGFYGWHIDHIKPCSSFNMLDINSQKECFHYSNLQPLWAFDNLSKNDKI
jgi:hypothetical protein